MPNITKTVVERLQPGEADRWEWDAELRGFGVRVQPSGRKTYVIRYRTAQRKQRKYTIGRCSDFTPDQARARARKAFGVVADGGDPAADRAAVLDAPTMKDLRERYMREHAVPYKKPSSVADDRQLWKNVIIPRWGDRTVASITQAQVMSLHAELAPTPAKANHVIALLSKAFNLSELWEWRLGNPCRGVKKYKIHERENILSLAEINKLLATAEEMAAGGEIPVPMANLLKLLLLTGCRLNEIMSARQEWVDHDRRLLLLPDSKVGQRRIPLSEAAMVVVRSVPKGTWLIPGRLHGTHMTSPWKMIARICKRAGVKHVRPHDLRHTVGSLGHRAGLSQREIARLLGHRQMSTTERYLHGYEGDDVRAIDRVAEIIAAA